MKRLLIAVLVASLGWFAYWFIGAQGARAAYEAWFDARRAEGWQAEYSDLLVRGFPNRFDTTFEDVSLVDPDTGLGWTAPFFQIFALSYRPNHVIAIWPEQHHILTPNQTLTVGSSSMQASAVVAPSTSLALTRANLAVDQLALSSSSDWSMTADTLGLAIRQQDDSETGYDLAFQGVGVAPPAALRTSILPATMSALDLDMSARFDRPWDLRAIEERRPQPTAISLRTARAKWGDLEFQAAGDVTVADGGLLDGSLTIRATEWGKMIAVARDSGQFKPVALDTLEQGLQLLASLSGSGDNIDVTLTFRRGIAFAGPLPLGPAPRLVLR